MFFYLKNFIDNVKREYKDFWRKEEVFIAYPMVLLYDEDKKWFKTVVLNTINLNINFILNKIKNYPAKYIKVNKLGAWIKVYSHNGIEKGIDKYLKRVRKPNKPILDKSFDRIEIILSLVGKELTLEQTNILLNSKQWYPYFHCKIDTPDTMEYDYYRDYDEWLDHRVRQARIDRARREHDYLVSIGEIVEDPNKW